MFRAPADCSRALTPATRSYVFRSARLATAIAVIALASAVPARAAAHVQVDVPAANAVLPESFIIGGWMLDFAATSDPGVSFAHVWLYPANGATPFFVGEVTRGPRPDVAARSEEHTSELQSPCNLVCRLLL